MPRLRLDEKMTGHELNERIRQLNEYRAEKKRKREELKAKAEAARLERQSKWKPCPFCGFTDNLTYCWNGEKTDWVQCGMCGATGPISDGEAHATENWNNRHAKVTP